MVASGTDGPRWICGHVNLTGTSSRGQGMCPGQLGGGGLVTHIKGLGEKGWVTLRWSSPMVSPPHPRSHRGCTDRDPSRPEQAGSNHLDWRRRAADPGCHLPRAGAPGKTCTGDRSPAVGRTRHKAGQELKTGLHSFSETQGRVTHLQPL